MKGKTASILKMFVSATPPPRVTTAFSARLTAMIVMLSVALTLTGCHSLAYLHNAKERPYDLWMAALKNQEGPVYYIGSDGDYSYFRAGDFIYTRYKAQTAKIHLPRTFPFGKEKPYRVTSEMVPKY
jgi:hypothetical protein